LTDYRNVRLNLDTYQRLRTDADAHGRPLGAHVGALLDRPADLQAGDIAERLDRLEAGIDRIASALQVLQVAVAAPSTNPLQARAPDHLRQDPVSLQVEPSPIGVLVDRLRERGELPPAPEPVAAEPSPSVKPPDAAAKRGARKDTRKGSPGVVQAVLSAAQEEGIPTTARELIAWRELRGLATQGDLAVLLGCSRQAISNQEKASGRGGDLDSTIGTRFLRRLLEARERGAV